MTIKHLQQQKWNSALVKAAYSRALEEQEHQRIRIGKATAGGTVRGALQRLAALGEEKLKSTLESIYWPVSWQDRNVFTSNLEEYYLPNDELFPQVASVPEPLKGEVVEVFRLLEHRDRLKALADFCELIGVNTDDKLPNTRGGRFIRNLWDGFINQKATQDLAARAKLRNDEASDHRWEVMCNITSLFFAVVPGEDLIARSDEPCERSLADDREIEKLLADLRTLRKSDSAPVSGS